jgi:hypothetical protein
VRLALAKAYGFKPHELGRLPLTYYQTLVLGITESAPKSKSEDEGEFDLDDVDDTDKVVEIDVDELIRQKRITGVT